MLFNSRGRFVLVVAIATTALCDLSNANTAAGVTSGYNLSADGPVIGSPPIQFTGTSYQVDLDLTFDPVAGPMTKNFDAPRYVTGGIIGLVGSQPLPFAVNENFTLDGRLPVSDWHEKILTPGWVWVTPGGPGVPGFPDLFPEGQTLITRNGTPWPSSPTSDPADPTRIDVRFDPITSGNVLDVHKALLWVGVTGPNDLWGDDPSETTITILEYPTPEPSTLVLAAVALVAMLGIAGNVG